MPRKMSCLKIRGPRKKRDSSVVIGSPAASFASISRIVQIERPGMKAEVGDSDGFKLAVEAFDLGGNGAFLFMQDKGDNVEARCRVVLRKDARLVHEDAQCPFVLHMPFKNESDGRTRHSRRRDTLASRRPRSDDRRRRILYQILRRESKGATQNRKAARTRKRRPSLMHSHLCTGA